MDSVAVTVPLRPSTKKMKKRKELDALAPPRAVSRRISGKRSSQELLTDSSDERSEYWSVSTRGSRKYRVRGNRACLGLLRACCAFLACASLLATATLVWLFVDVRQQLTVLRTELDQVIAGSEGVPDELQKCHTVSKDLQNNQTVISTHLSDLKLQIVNFTIQLAGIQHGLRQVQEWLQAAPELANLPKELTAVSNSVASFGSQIQDLDATVKTLKEVDERIRNVQTALLRNVTDMEHSLAVLSEVTRIPPIASTNNTVVKTDELSAMILQLASNLTNVNESLSRDLRWAIDDQMKDHYTLISLEEKTQNVSTKVMTLEGDCAKAEEQTALLAAVEKLSDQMNKIRTTDIELGGRLEQLELSYVASRNSTGTLSESSLGSESSQRKMPIGISKNQLTQETTTVLSRRNEGANGEFARQKDSIEQLKELDLERSNS